MLNTNLETIQRWFSISSSRIFIVCSTKPSEFQKMVDFGRKWPKNDFDEHLAWKVLDWRPTSSFNNWVDSELIHRNGESESTVSHNLNFIPKMINHHFRRKNISSVDSFYSRSADKIAKLKEKTKIFGFYLNVKIINLEIDDQDFAKVHFTKSDLISGTFPVHFRLNSGLFPLESS